MKSGHNVNAAGLTRHNQNEESVSMALIYLRYRRTEESNYSKLKAAVKVLVL